MLSPIVVLRWLTLGVWAFWLVFYWSGGVLLLRRSTRSNTKAHKHLDRAINAVIVLTAQSLVWTGIFASLGRIAVWADHWVTISLGLVVAVLGAWGTFYCRRFLGGLWSAGVALQRDHRVIDRGPYAIIRHPIYAAVLLMYIGTVLVFSTWWTWLSLALLVAVHIYRLLDEEAFLSANLSSYQNYRGRVPHRLIPGIW